MEENESPGAAKNRSLWVGRQAPAAKRAMEKK